MSQEVDQRVVEMRFDNAKFEKNVQQSINSLNALNESLKFEGAEKGFAEVEKASEKVDFDRMTTALETLTGKFSALEVIGMTALVKITDKAIDAGTKLAKSLSIDQVMSGWNKYAEKTASVQTIMNATGKSITKVNSYLSKLMWFSDETSYGFTDMTSALSTLTAAGGDIEKMIPMIMGMANATAYAGKGAAEFQRVVYNLAQSYGTGAIQLIDWKSVEQAGAGSQQLKQLIIDTAVELGKLKKGEVTTGTFGSTLQKKWADREVMEKAFGKYAEFAEAVKAELDANPEYHNQAALAIEALADQYDEVTVKAFKAAQEAKSFSEVIAATKDAVSSGWMQTFDILFGNYEEAKTFWSDLAEQFWDIFAGGISGRNSWLKKAFNGGMDQLLDDTALGDVGDAFTNQLRRSLIASGKLTEQQIEDAGSFKKALENAGVTADDLYERVQASLAGYEEAAKMSDAELAAQGVSRETLNKTIEAYRKMAEAIQNGEVSLDSYAAKMGQMSGREHFFNGILNILNGINSVLGPIRDGFDEVFHTDGGPLYSLLKGFDNLTSKLVLNEGVTNKLTKLFKGLFSVLSVGGKAIRVTGRIALALIGKLMNALEPLGDLLLRAGAAFGDVFTTLNESLDNAESIDDVINALAVAFGKLLQPVKDIFGLLRTLIHGGTVEEAKGQFKTFGGIVNAVSAVFQNFGLKGVSISGALGSAVKLLGGIFFAAFDGVGALIGKTFSAFQDAGKNVGDFKDKHLETLEQVRDTVVSLPEKAGAAMLWFAGCIQTAFYNVADASKTALTAVQAFFHLEDGIDLYRLFSIIAVGALAAAIYGATVLLKKASDNLKKTLANPISDFFDSLTSAVNTWTKAHTTNNLATAAKAIATAVALISGSIYLLSQIDDPDKVVQALFSAMAVLFGFIVALKALAATDLTGLNTAKLVGTIAAVSLGMTVLSAAMIKMGSMDVDQVKNGTEAIGHVAAVLTGMVGLLSLFNNRLGSMKGAGSFIAAAAAIDAIALVLIPLAKAKKNGLDIDGAVEAINGVAIAISILLVASGFAKKLAGQANVNTVDKIIKYLVKLGGLLIALSTLGPTLLMAAGAVAILASTGENLKNGLIGAAAITGLLAGVMAGLAILSKTKVNPLRMRKMATSMVIASASLVILAEAVKRMSDAMSSDESGAGFAGVAIGLTLMAGAIYILGKNAMESMGAAAALAAMGFALVEMAYAIKMLADTDPTFIMNALLGLAGAMVILVVGCAGLSIVTANITGLAASCLMLAGALYLLTPAFKGLASLTLDQAIAGIWAMAGVMIALGIVGANPPIAVGLKVLGDAFKDFAGALMKFSIAALMLGVIGLLSGPICKAIIGAGDDIAAALDIIVKTICNTITNNREVLAEAAASLVIIVIDTVFEVLNWGWEKLKAWIGEKGSEVSKMWNPFDLSGWVDTFTNKERLFGGLLNGITDPFLLPFDTSLDKLGNKLEDKIHPAKIVDDAAKTAVNSENAANATGVSATNMEKSATAMAVSAKSSEEMADGMIQVADDSGRVYTMTTEQAKAMLDGKTATEQTAGAVNDLGGAAARTTGKLSGTAAVMQTCAEKGAASTEVLNEAGNALEGKEEQLTDDTTTAVQNTMNEAGDTAEEGGKSAASRFVNGFLSILPKGLKDFLSGIGINTSGITAVVSGAADKVSGLKSVDDMLTNPDKKKTTAPTAKNGKTDSGGESRKDLLGDIAEQAKDAASNAASTLTSGKGKSKSSRSAGSKKTLAEQIEEKYKTRLEANKTLQSIIDQEYELWQAENQYSASEDELMAKKAAHAADAIKAQTERVSIAQAKYDALYSKWGAEKAETKSAYNELLEEKTSLAELKAKQYTDLFEEVAKRYDTNLDTLEKQYNLWSADNDRTTTKRDKILKEREYQTEELAIREKKEANAKEQYEKLGELYGEADLRTIEAYNEWLDAQTESLELRNSIAEKQYELIEADIEAIENAQNLAVSQMELLQKVYNDGDLSSRADDYKSAVETYGKDSKEARAAQYQGTVSGILAAVSAVKSMNAQMEQTLQYKQLLEQAEAAGDKERIQSYNEQLLNSQTAFLGFAENLADALNLGDTGKQVTLKLAKAIQKNWQPIKEGFNTAMDKAFANNPELKNKLTKAFGDAFSETGIEVGTEFVSTIVAMMQGDWANALASGLNFMIDFLNTKMGQDLMTTVLPKITELFSNVGKAAKGAQIGQAMGEMGGEMATVAEEGGGLITVLQAVAGGIGSVGTAVASFVAEFWPYILAAMAIVGVLAGIAALFNKKNKDAAEAGKDYDKNFSEGITDGKDTVKEAIRDMTDDATDTMASAIFDLRKTADDAFDLTPSITPIVDLSDMESSAQAMDEVVGTYDMTGDVSRKLAAQVDAQTEIQNGAKERSGAELLNAVHALGDRMDGVGESIRGMKMVVDGNKAIGYIDTKLGERSARRMR
nr:MAG TPA: tail tape measure [Caudoviricetes sp.]